ncbi:hypothetical protein [Thermaurantiacus sp.]
MKVLSFLAAALLPLAELPPQPFPPGSGCAIFLWTRGEPPVRVAMLSERNQSLRIIVGKQQVDLPRLQDPGAFGAGDLVVRIDLSLDAGQPIGAGAFVAGVMRIERANEEEVALAVGGLRACV